MTDWKKRAEELIPSGVHHEGDCDSDEVRIAAFKLGQEMVEAEREKLSRMFKNEADSGAWTLAATRVLDWASDILRKRKTREQRLEEALKEMPCTCFNHDYPLCAKDHRPSCPYRISAEALRDS